jgi:ABC-type phosphate transport system auxiliary subunit
MAFISDFVVGDDPVIALSIAAALGITAVIATTGLAAWWILPAAVIAALGSSLGRATRR